MVRGKVIFGFLPITIVALLGACFAISQAAAGIFYIESVGDNGDPVSMAQHRLIAGNRADGQIRLYPGPVPGNGHLWKLIPVEEEPSRGAATDAVVIYRNQTGRSLYVYIVQGNPGSAFQCPRDMHMDQLLPANGNYR